MSGIELFYRKVVHDLIKDKNASILVCGGEALDRNVLFHLGFLKVVITNIEKRDPDYSPYIWKNENAETLSFPDGSFDFVIMHAAIHHAQSPHKVLTEMYRVAKKGMLAFEGRDSFLIRIAEKFGFTQEYEVSENSWGVNGTEIPNYIYRWTEREIEKTIKSYSPFFKHRFTYKYATIYPNGPDLTISKKLFLKFLHPFFWLFVKVFPKQQNVFVFYVEKPLIRNSLLPWLIYDDSVQKIRCNKDWIDKKYKNLRNRRI